MCFISAVYFSHWNESLFSKAHRHIWIKFTIIKCNLCQGLLRDWDSSPKHKLRFSVFSSYLTAGKYLVLTALFHSLNVLCNPDSKAVIVSLWLVKSDAVHKGHTKHCNVDEEIYFCFCGKGGNIKGETRFVSLQYKYNTAEHWNTYTEFCWILLLNLDKDIVISCIWYNVKFYSFTVKWYIKSLSSRFSVIP